MASNNFLQTSIFMALCFAVPAYAEPVPVTLVQSVECAALPDKASVVVSQGQQIVAMVPAAIVMQEGASVVTLVARAPLAIEGGPYKALFTVYAKTGETASAVREIADVRLEPAILLEASELKRRLDEQKAELHKWDAQAGEQKSRLKKVQERADTLTSVGNIVDADDELGAVKDESDRLAASRALAQERQVALKSREVPPNYKKREAELSAHLNLLSTELKVAGKEGTLAGASREYQEKRALIDATKYEHIDLLKDELATLRRKREELENNVGR